MLARGFYVTVRDPDTGKGGFLLGPFGSHKEALNNVSLGTQLAYQHDARAPFLAYGTARVKADLPDHKPAIFDNHRKPDGVRIRGD